MKNDILYLVMPAYNEQDNIRSVVAQWYPVVEKIGSGSILLIVNDGSKDNTYKILLELQKDYPQLKAIDKPNSGHGATVIFAYQKAIEAGADFIFQTDSDGQTNPSEFWTFWENRNNYDFQIGHRKSRGDGTDRKLITKVLQWVIRFVFGEYVADANTPFRLMKTERLKLILEVIPSDSFLSNVLISTIAVKWKERYSWYPITFSPRQSGTSFINLKKIAKIGWKSIKDFRKMNNLLNHKNTEK
ncbi:MAG: glycosyltransferase family 2 protein [Prevotellaceae bacterium]|jgi:glycosyltransferase involved in cell wall biosynthesis|nr:glycosyltransferase family 2 protein [Prevotellaceae bacterium]